MELHSFAGADGAFPEAPLVIDLYGILYGTTLYGGAYNQGSIFQFANDNVTVVYSFNGGDDFAPNPPGPFPGVIRNHLDEFFGVTPVGGDYNRGRVYKVNRLGGMFQTLYSFTGSPDGELPYGELVLDKTGNLYGTTYRGGTYGVGTVFKVDKTGKETVIWNFTGNSDGAYPHGKLIIDAKGNLYGTTSNGGNLNFCNTGCGTVFKLTP